MSKEFGWETEKAAFSPKGCLKPKRDFGSFTDEGFLDEMMGLMVKAEEETIVKTAIKICTTAGRRTEEDC